ncbi:hypothetical protein GCM10008171_27430 [Methylopila jiangsuensis]|uniref:Uncharacterized protein n=1 Tax=Methylopila jiangsuensis TaxID=586230 RepID=A0A9W6JK17_9HYPH|nr:hypothetical protein [Methylopila jiangsuensis]MDR6285124.1 U3 small nucleolar ribonucleoprotein component [Methylopila jiangsuensis]GLK77489.1 hypothetical protein GCM10008171_27430 [Methylopila jiangsuensis]
MLKLTKESLFKPSKAEVKGDATTRAARAIIDQETARRDAKTARLREARLARDAAEQAAAPAPKAAPVRKRAKAAAAG